MARLRVYLVDMTIINSDELRTRVEWARNNGKASHEPGGAIRFEHQGRMYLIPAELLVTQAESAEGKVDLNAYAVRD